MTDDSKNATATAGPVLSEGLGPNAEAMERVRFEAWMDGLQFNLRRHAERQHQYANASVQGRWVTWQAAAMDMKARWMEACSTVSAGAEAAGRPGVQTVTQIRLLALGPNDQLERRP